MLRLRNLGLIGVLAAAGCEKGPETAEPTEATPDSQHPCDAAATVLVDSLQRDAFDVLAEHTSDPLTHDLSRAEFEDLAAIVQWLGTLETRTVEETDDTYGGGQRWYALQFEKAEPLRLEVSIDPEGKLIGFEFSGEGFTEAERGVLAEPFREFKVYDFHLLDADGNALPEDEPNPGNRVEYELVVGGIEALLGDHHLGVEEELLDADGNPMFKEPVEFDTKFEADAMGIPRGSVRGHVEVPGPGSWQLHLRITDENAHRDIEYTHAFETAAGS